MSTAGPLPCADFLTDIEHRRLVALAFADDNHTGDIQKGSAARASRSQRPDLRPFHRRDQSVWQRPARLASATRANPKDRARS